MAQKALNIVTVASGVISLVTTGQAIYQAAANAMDAVEVQGVLTGTQKKTALAFIKSMVLDLGNNWEEYEQLISAFIDKIKSAYNAVKDLFN